MLLMTCIRETRSEWLEKEDLEFEIPWNHLYSIVNIINTINIALGI